MKIAFTGTSGSGKTTLAKWTSKEFNLPFVSGSSGDILTREDRDSIKTIFAIEDGKGHSEVIKNSKEDWVYGMTLQEMILKRRTDIIENTPQFVTDRSPLDNFTFMVNQCGFHKEVDDPMMDSFLGRVIHAWKLLDAIIYIKPCQPTGIENNGSRIANKFYQNAIDAQFNMWLEYITYRFIPTNEVPILTISFWNLEQRKELVGNFIRGLL